ncbi:MAG: peptidase M23 [Flavobacterium sp.]|nr:MAG: peptidase M23 [Flavobacterium sp.]
MLDDFFKNLPPAQVLAVDGKYVPIDLSADNELIAELKTSKDFEDYIGEFLRQKKAVVAFGGYNERRNLYRRSDIFNDEESVRDIHIGIDLWAEAETAVLAPIDGIVHSFDFNTGLGNYGPTIILEHNISNTSFYTLYGHLSVESIEDIEIGDKIAAGEEFAALGDASVNGDYAPHLHFQIIIDIEDNFGDYPGVCSQSDLDHYLKNCPDPNLLLKLK